MQELEACWHVFQVATDDRWVFMQTKFLHCKQQGQASFVSIQTCCVCPSTAVGGAKGQPADGAEDIDADESLDESPGLLVFCSMQDLEACWHEPALYISDILGIDEWSGRELLKEYAHDADAADDR
jgi:hypothetical protein